MFHLYLMAFVALALGVGYGQEQSGGLRYSWLPEELPNPLKNSDTARACGLTGGNPGYICDPNHILSRRELDTVNWHLEGIANTEGGDCPCSQWWCDRQARARLPHFYKVVIALIPRLRLPRDTEGRQVEPIDQAQTFAFRLQNELWNISTCREDILVTMAGTTARQRLDAFSRRTIHAMVGQHFAEGRIVEGLLRMVYEMNLILNGNHYQNILAPAAQTSLATTVLPSLSLLILLATAVSLLSRC
ncbi:hypothetical protein BaRGS_00038212 [Batillaria attramentaria]|uniref:Uncharacterized protein n=1 Tax=Batillaria attramentaria TaxID=370345 RepID=A0ABD0J6I3_9CAEN